MENSSSTTECLMEKIDPAAVELERCVSAAAVVRRNEPMARRTTLRVGGPADLYVEPADEADLAAALRFCADRKLPLFVLGRGSNVLIKDRGFRGVILCLAHPYFARIEVESQRLECGAGARLKQVAVQAKQHNLTGMEFLQGIPGSIGGALRLNAGAMGGAMFDIVESIRMMALTGQATERMRVDLPVEYRSCSTFKTHIAISADLPGRNESRRTIL